MHDNPLYDPDEAEISWFFNDINLTMVILVLFFAIIFAAMIGESQGISSEQTQIQETEKQRPTDVSSSTYYGEEGFPEAKKEKGFPVKETFNTDLILTDNGTLREGMEGNLVWDFENLSTLRDKFLVRLYAAENGTLTWDGRAVTVDEVKENINQKAQKHNVFVRLSISPSAPIHVYESLRNDLWNTTNAVHWSFFTEDAPPQ